MLVRPVRGAQGGRPNSGVLIPNAGISLIPNAGIRLRKGLQGYLAHKKTHPYGPYSRHMPRVLGGS